MTRSGGGSSVVKTVEEGGDRLDVWLTQVEGIHSRAQARRLIDEGHVKLNGVRPNKAGVVVKPGDVVEIDFPPPVALTLEPEPIELDIRYEDAELMVINKPRGMVVHPAPGHYSGTLVHAVLHHAPDLTGVGGALRPGIVHRLDKETTGLLVVAKTERAHVSLARQLKERTMLREYRALVRGVVKWDRGVIDAPIGRHPTKRQQMAVVEGGREARTRFWVIRRLAGHTFMGLSLETGRTHQIRVHLSHVGHPVVGDRVYGGRGERLPDGGYALHAAKLGFQHPASGEYMEFESGLPSDFAEFMHRLMSPSVP